MIFSSRTKHSLFIVVVCVYVAVGAVSPFVIMAMDHEGHTGAGGCLFMSGQVGLCEMTALGHLSLWQAMMAGIVPLLLATIALAPLFIFRLLEQFLAPPGNSLPLQVRYQLLAIIGIFSRPVVAQRGIYPRAP